MGDRNANVTVRQKVLSGKEIKGLAADKQKKKILEARLDVQAIAEIVDDEELLEQPGAAVILRLREVLSKGNVRKVYVLRVLYMSLRTLCYVRCCACAVARMLVAYALRVCCCACAVAVARITLRYIMLRCVYGSLSLLLTIHRTTFLFLPLNLLTRTNSSFLIKEYSLLVPIFSNRT